MPAWSKQSKKLRLVVRPRKKGIYWRAEEPSSHLNNIPWNRLASQRATSIGIARKVALYSVVEPRWPFSTVKAIVIFHVRCGGVLVSVQLWLSKLREQYLGFYNTQHAFFKRYSFLFFPIYVSVKSKLQHSPAYPPGDLPGIWLFWKLLFKFPPTRAKMPFKCPTLGSIQVIKCPHPGDISQAHKWQKDGRNAFSCRTKSL